MTPAQVEALIQKLDSGTELAEADSQQAAQLVHALVASVRLFSEQGEHLSRTIQILQGAEAALTANHQSAMAALRSVKSPQKSVDFEVATESIAALRADIDKAAGAVEVATRIAGFAVDLAGKLA